MTVPGDAYVAMDYHLDWLQMALYLADKPERQERVPNDDLVAGTQEDADLLVAFEGESTTHLVLVEAKVETGWTNKQLKSKADGLPGSSARAVPGTHLTTPHYVLASPRPPPRMSARTAGPLDDAGRPPCLDRVEAAAGSAQGHPLR